jgi:hypothetical protein
MTIMPKDECIGYKKFIEDNFQIVDKQGNLVDFRCNPIQDKYLLQDMSGSDIILKARQQGFSSIITALFATDFLLVPNSYSVIIADIEENAIGLLSKVKQYVESYEYKNKIKIPFKYESRFELDNSLMKSKFIIGTAKNIDFGRSRTFTNLHCSEVAFYSNIESIKAGAVQAVVASGRKIFETTANGFNEFRKFYMSAKEGANNYRAHFYRASAFYTEEFLAMKKKELGRLYPQEYPETDIEAFLTSGECFFDMGALKRHLDFATVAKPLTQDLVYINMVV